MGMAEEGVGAGVGIEALSGDCGGGATVVSGDAVVVTAGVDTGESAGVTGATLRARTLAFGANFVLDLSEVLE